MEISFIGTAHFLAGLYSLILILVGTPLNLLCYYIFKRLVPNRTNPTIIVFAYLALIELLIPFTWNINYVVRELIWKYRKDTSMRNLEQYSLWVCKLISYGAYFSLQCAAWLKTLATFARCALLHHQWTLKKWLSKPAIIHRVAWAVVFVIALINFPICIINGERVVYKDVNNQTKVDTICYQSRFFKYWEIAHLLLYNFIPFALMIFCNINIVHQVRASRRRTQRSKMRSSSLQNRRPKSSNGGRLTKTLVLITVFFIIFTSPAAIFYIFLGKNKAIKPHRNLITMALSNLATTSHVTSFIIYWLTSTDFRDAAISLLLCRPIATVVRAPTEERQHEKPISDQATSSRTTESTKDNQRKSPLLQSSLAAT